MAGEQWKDPTEAQERRMGILFACDEDLTDDDTFFLFDEKIVPDEDLLEAIARRLQENGVADTQSYLRDRGIIE